MTTKPPSRKTLADLFPLISHADISEKAKAELSSAVRKVAQVLGTDPTFLPIDPQSLRRRLEPISHQMACVSHGRWNNVRSLFTKALALAAPIIPGRSIAPLLPEWLALADSLEFGRRTRLLPLFRRLSEMGVLPHQVALSDLEAYRAAICGDRLRARPERTWDTLVWSWNACVREIPGWPQVMIPREAKREVYTFSWDYFPASLHEDAKAYLRRLAMTSLEEDGPNKPARPATLETRERQLRMAAAAAVHQGVPPEELTSLEALLRFDRYQMILRFFLNRNDGKPTPQVGYIAAFLKTVAKYWLRLDEDALRPYEKISSRLNQQNGRRTMTAKNRERLRPLDDPELVQRFLSLPFKIREEVEKDKRSPIKRRALRAQIAAGIAILQMMPVRRKNLHEIDIEKNLIQRGKRLYLVIESSDVKNSEAIDFEFPPETKEIIAWYVREYRPHLLRKETSALFPGEGAGPKSAGTLSAQIKKTIRDHLGLEFNLHLFRHAGTKIYLDVRPGNYEVMRRVLGHRSIETTTSTYAGAETKTAGLHFASVLNERRRSSELPERVRPPRRKANKATGGGS